MRMTEPLPNCSLDLAECDVQRFLAFHSHPPDARLLANTIPGLRTAPLTGADVKGKAAAPDGANGAELRAAAARSRGRSRKRTTVTCGSQADAHARRRRGARDRAARARRGTSRRRSDRRGRACRPSASRGSARAPGAERLGRSRLLAQHARRLGSSAPRGCEPRNARVTCKLPTGRAARRGARLPQRDELVDDVVRELEREEEPDPVIALDGSRLPSRAMCVESPTIDARGEATAAVARPRIISRSPGSSVRTVFSPSGPTAWTNDEPDGLVRRAPPGPATPVTATPTSAPSRSRTPCAIAAAASRRALRRARLRIDAGHAEARAS